MQEAGQDQWHVLATSSRSDDRSRVLKYGKTFAVLDRFGNACADGSEQGVYHEGTRFLSRAELKINGHRPMLLNSTVKGDDSLLAIDLTTPDLYQADRLAVPKGTVHVFRGKLLWEDACYERIRISNHGIDPVRLRVSYHAEADFADIFEVRGFRRERRGRLLPVQADSEGLRFCYRGLDGVERRTRIAFEPQATEIQGSIACFELSLAANEVRELYIAARFEKAASRTQRIGYEQARVAVADALEQARGRGCRIESSNEQFNAWIRRSAADVAMLTAGNPERCYPYAGVPWYSTPFGRDGIIAALHYLWVDPSLAHGVLTFLAHTQATECDAARDAEPGKILHEAREGELAMLGEIPFGRYYGSVDATPLFVVLAGAYYRRTGDRALIDSIWTNIERALQWIDGYGDRDGDGFVEYQRANGDGLVNQGWKDSEDAVFHRDGTLARGPIALCEVQGYVYRARLEGAILASVRGDEGYARRLREQACCLRDRFEQIYWCEELDTYALALDGEKKRCEVRASNAGHLLWCGMADTERAHRVASTLMSDAFYSGWGIRTVALGERRFNPMSYHNGSIWPHDNALIAAGMARYGRTGKSYAVQVLSGMFEASAAMDQHRLPELFCGFVRRESEAPTLYPVACSPQVWAATTVFQLLQACLGISFQDGSIRIDRPMLPPFLERLSLYDLRVGEAQLDLVCQRHEQAVSVNILRKTADVEVAVLF